MFNTTVHYCETFIIVEVNSFSLIVDSDFVNMSAVLYSASQVHNATVDCFLDFHEINEPVSASMKTYPVIQRRSFEFAQSASQYPIKFKSASDFLKVRP